MSATVSRWDVARTPTTCSTLRCGAVIGEGEQLRRVGPGQWPVCVPCCKVRFDLEPPPQMPVLSFLDGLARFRQRTEAGFVAAADVAHDYKVAQMAREPGEDG